MYRALKKQKCSWRRNNRVRFSRTTKHKDLSEAVIEWAVPPVQQKLCISAAMFAFSYTAFTGKKMCSGLGAGRAIQNLSLILLVYDWTLKKRLNSILPAEKRKLAREHWMSNLSLWNLSTAVATYNKTFLFISHNLTQSSIKDQWSTTNVLVSFSWRNGMAKPGTLVHLSIRNSDCCQTRLSIL